MIRIRFLMSLASIYLIGIGCPDNVSWVHSCTDLLRTVGPDSRSGEISPRETTPSSMTSRWRNLSDLSMGTSSQCHVLGNTSVGHSTTPFGRYPSMVTLTLSDPLMRYLTVLFERCPYKPLNDSF